MAEDINPHTARHNDFLLSISKNEVGYVTSLPWLKILIPTQQNITTFYCLFQRMRLVMSGAYHG